MASAITTQVITATGAGVYTPTPGTVAVIIELQGAGGGGSGVVQATAAQVNLGGGGGAGAYLRKTLTANFSGAAYVVGAKGTGGTAGNNNGNDGADTTFTATGGGTVYTAGGGKGGAFRGSFAPPITQNSAPASTGAGGLATNGDVNKDGDPGGEGIAPNASVGWAGYGAASAFGARSFAQAVVSAAGSAGATPNGKGNGGGGAISCNAGGGNKAGGDGNDGMIIFTEIHVIAALLLFAQIWT